jgi:hypothetical protein
LFEGFVEGLVLRSQHDCDNPLCDGRVFWIWRVQVSVLVVIIDFENDGCAFEIDRAKVVLAVGIIGGAKVVKGRDSIGQAANGFLAEGRDAGGQEDAALYKCRRNSSLSALIRSVSEDMVVSVPMTLI